MGLSADAGDLKPFRQASDAGFDYIVRPNAPQPRALHGPCSRGARKAAEIEGTMEEILQRIGAFALAGLASGFSSGLFGIGGGIVRIPIFVYLLPLFGVPSPVLMHVAVGTSMALVLPSALASTRKQVALGNLDLAFFKTWALGIFVGVLIGTALVPLASTEILQTIFAAFMVTVGVYSGFYKHRMVIAKAAPRGALKLALAAAIGLLAALT